MPTKLRRIGVTPTKDIFRWAMSAAFKEKRSLSQLCVVALESYLRERHPELDPERTPGGFCADIPQEEEEYCGFI